MTKTKRRRYYRVLPDGDEVHVTAGYSKERSKQDYYLFSTRLGGVAKFRAEVERFAVDHAFSVTLIMCCDSEETCGAELFEFLERQAKEKNFSFTASRSAATTAEEVDAMQFQEWIKNDRNFGKIMRDLERRGLFESSVGDDGKLYYRRTERQVSDDEIEQLPKQRRGLDS